MFCLKSETPHVWDLKGCDKPSIWGPFSTDWLKDQGSSKTEVCSWTILAVVGRLISLISFSSSYFCSATKKLMEYAGCVHVPLFQWVAGQTLKTFWLVPTASKGCLRPKNRL